LQPGANDVYVVKGQRNLMVPVLKRVIRSVDVDQRLIVLDAQVLPEVAVFED
jgi:ribosomal 30S subunit maturation factor RimM